MADIKIQQDIHLISTSIVKAASYEEPVHSQTIELTPWDLQFLLVGPIQKGLLFLKRTSLYQNQELENSVIHHLKTSLSRTLDFFPPLAGRLAETKHDDDTSSFSIACNNAGAEFVHAIAHNVTIADILEPVYVPKVLHSFFAFHGGKNYEGISKPLLAVQVTELVDGIFIGCTMNHAVADGTSFWNFFNSWSEISRGSDKITNPPVLQSMFLDGTDHPIHIHLPNQDAKAIEKPRIPPPLQERVFHFTKENIAALKAKANAEIGSSNNQISSLQALAANLLVSVTRSRGLKPDQEVYLWILIGCRSRLQQPTLTTNYFGNAIHQAIVEMQAGELLEHGLGYTALQMNKMVALQTEERAKSFLRSWAKDPKVLTLGGIDQKDDAIVALSSSPRFNVYGTDFGWGRPMAVRSGGGNKIDGKMTLFPGAEEGSVDIEVCLLAETLETLGNDQDFMGVVTAL